MRSAITVLVPALLLLSVGPGIAATYVQGSLPSEFAAGHSTPLIPFEPEVFRNVQAAGDVVRKLRLAVQKCYAKGAARVAAGRPSGVAACITDPGSGALAKYQARIAALEARAGSLPPCAGFAHRGSEVAELTRALFAWAYCGDPPDLGSPSGAFVDGAPAL